MPVRVDPVAPLDRPSAMVYIEQARHLLSAAEYQRFQDLRRDMRTRGVDLKEDLTRIINLMHRHMSLVVGYAAFLPNGFLINYEHEPTHIDDWYFITVTTPYGEVYEYRFRDSRV
ncbi:hypothetical protein CVT24_000633 [Panaeolus cyanescens]|uniref:Uncharacterized protein n=1 Tax=Panaeolus cyanescens TaxID=181874 RepID=A0A409WBG2_9AGAR|nr:hypothetical protein CVT24_000633 [Panaeolus cyanescens]